MDRVHVPQRYRRDRGHHEGQSRRGALARATARGTARASIVFIGDYDFVALFDSGGFMFRAPRIDRQAPGAQASRCDAGTPIVCRMTANMSGPRESFAHPCAMNP